LIHLMRILHIDTERGWRGGERQALWLAEELQRRGHESIVAARPREPLATRAGDVGLQVVPCAPGFEADLRSALRLRRQIIDLRVDIVHAHTGHAVGLGALATLATRVPLVVSRRVDFRLRRNVGTRLKYSRATAIIAISRAVAKVLVTSGADADKIVVVPDGTDVHRTIAPAVPAVLAALGVRPGAVLVVHIRIRSTSCVPSPPRDLGCRHCRRCSSAMVHCARRWTKPRGRSI
jgi:hypothetical protein